MPGLFNSDLCWGALGGNAVHLQWGEPGLSGSENPAQPAELPGGHRPLLGGRVGPDPVFGGGGIGKRYLGRIDGVALVTANALALVRLPALEGLPQLRL